MSNSLISSVVSYPSLTKQHPSKLKDVSIPRSNQSYERALEKQNSDERSDISLRSSNSGSIESEQINSYHMKPKSSKITSVSSEHIKFSSLGKKKRRRKKYYEVERFYMCNYPNCNKAYGTLGHLNCHILRKKHGRKRLPSEFKELRRRLEIRRINQEQERMQSPIDGNKYIVNQLYNRMSPFDPRPQLQIALPQAPICSYHPGPMPPSVNSNCRWIPTGIPTPASDNYCCAPARFNPIGPVVGYPPPVSPTNVVPATQIITPPNSVGCPPNTNLRYNMGYNYLPGALPPSPTPAFRLVSTPKCTPRYPRFWRV
ncbi:hypothetical protein HII13_004828 [Brettanomyces bruxellensis]|uniref:Uncharacterized protein n=1 Tax=Dekkera bruxellensis TaxID=5007 RepID=A0A8H6B8A2_DEKBR|nr:hypothetical protein HII13_004828 [Brettanomyces bruxellensis]KAF6010164.1 hypothetical protein HII12_003040 [Brettanomyces bruxellensis]